MTKVSLPIVDGPPSDGANRPSRLSSSQRLWRRLGLQCYRVLVLAAIVAIIHWSVDPASQSLEFAEVSPERLRAIQAVVPSARQLQLAEIDRAVWLEVLDAEAQRVALAAFTQPVASDVLGFSGPTDVLIVARPDKTVRHVKIVRSADTRDHVEQIREDDRFLPSLIDRKVSDIENWQVDSVSGATLTSLAIVESLRKRFQSKGVDVQQGFAFASLRFPDSVPELEQVNARANPQTGLYDRGNPGGGAAEEVEHWLRVAPVGDTVIGYQGPTDTLVRLDGNLVVVGLAVLESYDNEPYTDYVRDDWGFPRIFNGLTLGELAEVDAASIEGVSGATMTSQAVAKSVVLAASNRRQIADQLQSNSRDVENQQSPVSSNNPLKWFSLGSVSLRDASTVGFVFLAVLVATTRMNRFAPLRVALQIGVIVWMGWLNGDLLSQALWSGWAMHGVAWSKCIGLVVLSAAAILLPVLSGKNTYCSHMCPHGAVQQLMRKFMPFRVRLPIWLQRGLKVVPTLLLAWVIVVAVCRIGLSLVDIEPFDAWVWTIAGWPTVVIAVVGLAFAAISPMGYCRFGCPTGAMLNGLRRSGTTWSNVDSAATLLLLLAALCWLLR